MKRFIVREGLEFDIEEEKRSSKLVRAVKIIVLIILVPLIIGIISNAVWAALSR